MKICSLLFSAFLFVPFVLDTLSASEHLDPRVVRIYIPSSGEEHAVKLKPHQKASVFIYLSSLGDPLDGYMVSLVSDRDNKLAANRLSGPDGEIVFKKIDEGEYTVFVNRRVVRDEEISSVKVADVRIKALP
jgi:hypothetical protein